MLGRTDSRLRMVGILMVFVIFATAAGLRLGYWQVVAAPELSKVAVTRMSKPEVVRIARAPIVDRNGRALARTVSLDRLNAHPVLIKPEARQGVVDVLTEILQLSPAEQQQYLDRISTDHEWVRLDMRLTQKESVDVGLEMAAGHLPGVELEPFDVRSYPSSGGQGGTSLASHLIGFVAGDGRGATGVERLYDARLTTPVESSVELASLSGTAIDLGEGDAPPLELTIDQKLQRQLEKELTSARLTTSAKSVSAIIMDPYTGEILASASSPGYDANDYAEVASDHPDRLRDPVVSDLYEPGSVMKIFTATAAIDNGVVTPQTKIRDVPQIKFHGATVHNSDWKGMGTIPVKDVVAYSRNVGITKVAEKLAPRSTTAAARKLYELWDRIGLVGKTGIDIAGEESGIYCDPDAGCPWAPVDLANRAFGQGVSVTLLQLANGISTIVNGGYRVQPHVVAESDAAQVPKRRVLRAKVAREALDILVRVTGAVPWYAEGALIPGYMIGGKTGTAQIWDSRKGNWKKNIFNHTFVGFVGGDEPDVVIAVRLEEPKVKVLGQGNIEVKIQSYELFQNIARSAIKRLGVNKSKDKNAGLPIIGSQAAQWLTPQRNLQARQETRRRAARRDGGSAKKGGRSSTKANKARRKRDDTDPLTAADVQGGQPSDGREP